MHKVILDTNVILSGVLFGGNPEKIIKRIAQRKIIFCISPPLQAEVIQKLELKFSLFPESMEKANRILDTFGKKFVPRKKLRILKDKKDNFLLELAEESRADYLISGDKEVLKLKKYKGTKILSSKEFLNLFP